ALGMQYTNNTINFRVIPKDRPISEGFKYRCGMQTNVYYNPKKPEISCLEPSSKSNFADISLTILCSLAVIISGSLMIFKVRKIITKLYKTTVYKRSLRK